MAEIFGDAGDNTIDGTNGDDILHGEGGNDTLNGGDANDTLEGGQGNDTLNGGAGTDTATYENHDEGVVGSVNFVQSVSEDESDSLISIENLIGSAFNDSLSGNNLANVLWGRGGVDNLIGNNGDDVLYGEAGDDNLRGRNDNDTLYGGDANDFLQGGEGNDTIDGGAGWDRANFFLSLPTDAQIGANVDLAIQGVAQDTNHGLDTLIGIEHVSGTTLADNLYGNAGVNWIWGQGGGDTLDGRDGDDLIETGSAGANTVIGGAGNDTLSFFNNNDFTSGVVASLLLQGASQSVAGGGSFTATGFENLSGSSFNDTLTGDTGANRLQGAEGNDTLEGGDGADTLHGDGITIMDSATGGSGPITSFSDVALLPTPGVSGNDTLRGGAGNDSLDGGGGDDLLLGGAGNDTIVGGAGVDTVSYEDAVNNIGVGVFLWRPSNHSQGDGGVDQIIGIENVIGSTTSDTLEGDANNNVLTGLAGNDALVGHQGDDTLEGGAGFDFLRGRDGNDIMRGGADDDFLSGGEGDDTFDGGDGIDRASMFLIASDPQTGTTVDLAIVGPQDTGHGMDTFISIEHVSGTAFGDFLYGDAGANWLWGIGGGDTLDGRDGDDVIEVGNGLNTLIGGNGVDTASFFNNNDFTSGVRVNLTLQGAAQDTTGGMMTLTGFENISGSAFNDELTGDAATNVLAGRSGNDILNGGDGGDTLLGDGMISAITTQGGSGPIQTIDDVAVQQANPALSGNDTLRGGAGMDTLKGGGGDDLLLGGADNDVIQGGDGIDTVSYEDAVNNIGVGVYLWRASNHSQGDGGVDQITGVENVTGSTVSDTLEGDGNNNVLTGLGGNDLLIGHAGDDTLEGGAGEDFLRGRDGNDVMNGGADNDFLSGGEGNDTANGGDGFDRASMFLIASDPQTGVTVDLAIAGPQNTGHGMDTFISIEHVSGTAYGDFLYGDAGANWLWGVGGGDTLDGRDGDDLIDVGNGVNTLVGGAGVDTASFFNNNDFTAGVRINLNLQGAAQDTNGGMMTLTGFENISGSAFGDELEGDNAANVLAGRGGADRLIGGGGADTLLGDGGFLAVSTQGGSGPITMIEDLAVHFSDTLYNGNDTLEGGEGNDILRGGGGDDVLNGGANNDTVDGGDGYDEASYADATGAVQVNLLNNTANGADGFDSLVSIEAVEGSDFADLVRGANQSSHVERLSGGDGTDQLLGNGGSDVLLGGNDDDLIRGGDGNDEVYGGDGNDYVQGSEGDDLVDGGDGADRIAFNLTGADPLVGATVDLNIQGVAQDTGHGMDTLVSVEHASGTAYDDVLTGNAGDNWLWGQAGSDVLTGADGNDLLQVGDGNHQVDGGNDIDTAGFVLTTTGVTLSLAIAGAQTTGALTVTLTDIENLSGSALADSLTGDAGDNVLAGGVEADSLFGGDGADALYGDGEYAVTGIGYSGDISLFVDEVSSETPGAGADTLSGGAGDDLLRGGGANDSLDGGLDNDTAVWTGNRADYTITEVSAGIVTVTDNRLGGTEGTDTVANVETFRFADGDYSYLAVSTPPPVTTADHLQTTIGIASSLDASLLLMNDSFDPDDTFPTVTAVSNAIGASVALVAGKLVITASAASGSFEYTVTGVGGSTTGAVTFGAVTSNNLVQTHAPSGGAVAVDFWGLGGNDSLTGTDNADRLVGGDGNDVLQGGLGDDIMSGDAGNDTFHVDSLDDAIFEASGGGTDTVISSIDYTLGEELEKLTLTGAAISATGNSLGNTLTGTAGDNVLDGRAGADIMNGGSGGSDTYYVDNVGDVIQDAGVGTDTVFTTLNTYTLGNTLENLYFAGTGDFTGTGTSLANQISGDDGNDRLDGLGGNDSMTGKLGDDTYVVGQAGDVINEAADEGYDSLEASASYVLAGSASVERLTAVGIAAVNLTANALDNELYGNSAANVLNGGAGADHMEGGGGADTYHVDNAGDDVVEALNAGTDLVISSVDFTLGDNLENLTLVGSAIYGYGNALANTLLGNAQDNVLDGGALGDSMTGGAGNDAYYVDNAGDSVIEGVSAGVDQVYTTLNSYTLSANVEDLFFEGTGSFSGTGTNFANVIVGGDSNDTLNGLSGDDYLDGGLGADAMNGGLGSDTFVVDDAGDTVTDSGAGTDTVQVYIASYTLGANVENLDVAFTGGFTGVGNTLANLMSGWTGVDNLSGLAGADTLIGDAGDDTLSGGDGNDILDGGTGADAMSGGLNDDTYYVDDAGDSTTEGLSQGTDKVRTTLLTYTLAVNVENLDYLLTGNFTGHGNTLANTITGNTGNDTLNGNDGDDKLYGGAGTDTLNGGIGTDTLDGQGGADAMTGGAGNDTYFVDDAGDTTVELAGGGTDTVRLTTNAAYTVGDQIEVVQFTGSGAANVTGNGQVNTIIGGAGDDTINGGAGGDTLRGGLGVDTINGGNDNDKIYGEDGADVLFGDAGNDFIYGGAGADQLTGGIGKDYFTLNTAAESGVGAGLRDVVLDFDTLDVIDLHLIDADPVTAGDQAFSFIGAAAFSGVAGQVRYVNDGEGTHVFGDIDGDTVADFEVLITATVAMNAADFIL